LEKEVMFAFFAWLREASLPRGRCWEHHVFGTRCLRSHNCHAAITNIPFILCKEKNGLFSVGVKIGILYSVAISSKNTLCVELAHGTEPLELN
jgi:hypothetical protein